MGSASPVHVEGDTVMKRQVRFLTFSFLFLSVLSSAQSNCPQGFVFVGSLSGTGSQTQEFNKKVELKLPPGATLDESFQQSTVRSTNAKVKANLRPQDIPRGILIIPYGSNDSEKVWSVSEPTIKRENNETSSSRYIFGMHLFCMVKVHTFSQNTGGCEVSVEVCYKPTSKN
jgi:hypothetical protein